MSAQHRAAHSSRAASTPRAQHRDGSSPRDPQTAATPAPRLRLGRRTAAGGALAVVAAVAVPFGVALASQPGSSTGALARDGFQRIVASGMGSADSGGAWTVTGATNAAAVAVKPGGASVSGLRPGTSFNAWLPGPTAQDELVSTTVDLPTTSAAASGLYVADQARRQADGSSYRGKLVFGTGSSALLIVSRTAAGGAETNLAYASIPLSLAAGQDVTVQLQVTGTSPATVSVRAFPAGTTAPAWQLVKQDSDAARVQSAGSTGLWNYVSSAASARSFRVVSFAADALGTSTPNPAPTSSTPTRSTPTSSAPTSSAPTSSAPTSTTSSTTAPAPAPTSSSSSSSAPVSSGQAGSAAVGSAAYSVPSGALFVSPSGSDSGSGSESSPLRTVQAAVNRVAAGQTIVLRAGTYHESIQTAKSNFTMQAYPKEAVWFDGSTSVTGWTQSGSTWVHDGWTVRHDHNAGFSAGQNDPSYVNAAHPMAAWPDMVFVDGTSLTQVASGSSVGSGQFSIDYSTGRITVGSNPNGHDVRSSDLETAFTLVGSGVTLQGFGVHRYATPMPQIGTVRAWGGNDTLRDLVVSDNATQGVTFMKTGDVAQRLTVEHNGMTGIHGNTADGLSVVDCLVQDNNAEGFNPGPSTGGMKVTRIHGLTVKDNVFQRNGSTGIWLDQTVTNFVITGNRSVDNMPGDGIVTELSRQGIVANNTVSDVSYGILVLDSQSIQVYNNAVSGVDQREIALMGDNRSPSTTSFNCDPRYPCPADGWLVRDDVVANNTLDGSGHHEVYVLDANNNRSADSMNLKIVGNRFTTGTGASVLSWGGGNNQIASFFSDILAFDLLKGWRNTQVAKGATALVSSSAAVGLPADVAAAVGVPTGTVHLGTF